RRAIRRNVTLRPALHRHDDIDRALPRIADLAAMDVANDELEELVRPLPTAGAVLAIPLPLHLEREILRPVRRPDPDGRLRRLSDVLGRLARLIADLLGRALEAGTREDGAGEERRKGGDGGDAVAHGAGPCRPRAVAELR